MAKLNMVKALNLALLEEMERDPDVVIIGEDVGVDGGVFRVTEDLHRRFGGRRVIDSPLAEAGIIGASIGMALYGLKPVSEIQFSGFAFQCFHQIENHAARYRQRSQSRFHCQMVMRMPYGGGVRALEHHSESEQFYAIGTKMVIPPARRPAPRSAIGIPTRGGWSTRRSTMPPRRCRRDRVMPILQAQVREVRTTLIAYGPAAGALEGGGHAPGQDGVVPECSISDHLALRHGPSPPRWARPGAPSSFTRRREASAPPRRSTPASWRAPSSRWRRPSAV